MATFDGLLGWDDARAKALFPITEEHIDFARGNKASAIIWMTPRDFLAVSTPVTWRTPPAVFEFYLDLLMHEATPFDVARAQRETQLPFLKVSLDTKFVEGHEGRHRAAGLLKSNYNGLMPVAIMLTKDGYTKRLSLADVPVLIKPQQFGRDFFSRNDPMFIDSRNTKDALDLS